MRKQLLSKFITIFFAFITVLLINTLNSYSVKAAENENNDEYYLLTKDTCYMVENDTDNDEKLELYTKDKSGNYVKSNKQELDYIEFNCQDNPPTDSAACFSSVRLKSKFKILIGTLNNNNIYIKIPLKFKINELNTPFWYDYSLKKNNSVKIQQSVNDSDVAVHFRFTNNNGDTPTIDYRYCGSKGLVWNISNCKNNSDAIYNKEHSLSIFAEYEDVNIHIPTYFKPYIKLTLSNHPHYYTYTLEKGKNLVINYKGNSSSNVRVATSHEKVDCIRSDRWIFNDEKIVYRNYYYGLSSIKNFEFHSNYSLGLFAGYDTNVTIQIPYDDIDNYNFVLCNPLFETFTIEPNKALKIVNPIDESIHVGVTDKIDKYYYEEFNSKNEFILNSSNLFQTDQEYIYHKTANFDDYSFIIAKDCYAILQNISDKPLSFRLPVELSDYVSNDVDFINNSDRKYDLNDDNLVNLLDFSILASKYNLTNLDSSFDKKYDLNNDGICDIYDIVMMSGMMK